MKDPILEYIEKNKELLDNYTPDKKNWDDIQNKMANRRKRSSLIILGTVAASLLFIMLFNNFINSEPEKEQVLALVDSSSMPLEERLDRSMMNYTSDVDYNFTRGRGNYQGLAKNYEGYTWMMLSESSTGVVSGTYTFDVADNNACYTVDNETGNSHPTKDYFGYDASLAPVKSESYNETSYDYYYQEPQLDVGHYYEQYDYFKENPFETPLGKPLSTFGIDVDAASYSNVRRFLNGNFLPPKDAVKLEEMINYFNYDLPEPEDGKPFSISTEVAACPWQKDNILMQVALKGEEIVMDEEQSNNLVFLIDVSGSMSSYDKLPLLKESLGLCVEQMGEDDRIAIVVYAGAAGLVLPSTSGAHQTTILEAIQNLEAGGSTAGGAGIELAYKIATQEFMEDGNNRIILATDGDFNVGVSDDASLVRLIEEKRETGVFLTCLGFGTGNLQSSKMEKLADNGNGNYYYIDNILEGKKVLVDEIGGTLVTIAKDVKLQLEFNPEVVKSYRLLGYENRLLADRDFDDDTKDAGDLGSGHTVVAFYEIELREADDRDQEVGGLRYQSRISNSSKGLEDELVWIKFRYKHPKSKSSKLIEKIVSTDINHDPGVNFMFASAVAEFGMLIRESKYRSDASFDAVIDRAEKSLGEDPKGYRAEFIELVKKGRDLMNEYYSQK